MEYLPQLRKAILKARAWKVHQFGQANDYYTFGGTTGCTHTVLQRLIYLWKGIKVTHDQISKIAGYPLPGKNPGKRGLYPYEVERVIAHYKLPYKIVTGWTADQVLERSEWAPVGFGMAYSDYPEWKGYKYGRITADGKPNGYATPSGEAGKTQLKGFTGAHFGLLMGRATDPAKPDKVYCHEPNHNSAARPENPAYDIMTVLQFKRTFNSYNTRLGRSTYALIPTKKLPASGY